MNKAEKLNNASPTPTPTPTGTFGISMAECWGVFQEWNGADELDAGFCVLKVHARHE